MGSSKYDAMPLLYAYMLAVIVLFLGGPILCFVQSNHNINCISLAKIYLNLFIIFELFHLAVRKWFTG